MKKTVLLVLALSGLCALAANIVRKYHYVNQPKTWAEAQSYCRENFTDLATIDNQDDNDRLLSILEENAWIGLYDDRQLWNWSLGNEDFKNEFSNWAESEPDNFRSEDDCAEMNIGGLWYDVPCSMTFAAVCYHEQGPAKYIFVPTTMTWENARTYCRSHYTDLASVRNVSESNQIIPLVSAKAWIGLHRKLWAYWSDQTPRTFTDWQEKEPNNSGCTMISIKIGKWREKDCEQLFHFVCQTVSYSHHKTTLKLKFQSEADLNDPALQQQILKQLHGKLEKHELPDFKLSWIQTDGQTFHKEQDEKKEKGSCG